MHRSETTELVACADCGAEILPRLDRAFSLESEAVLCWACAVRRGGTYDEERDYWTAPPDTNDL